MSSMKNNFPQQSLMAWIVFFTENFDKNDFETANEVASWSDEKRAAFRMAYRIFKEEGEGNKVLARKKLKDTIHEEKKDE